MNPLREAAQQALEALETLVPTKGPSIYNSARDALRAALAQQNDPTDPGNDVDALREHVRHLERRIRELHAQQAEPLNLSDPAIQKRLAAQWGYVPAAQAEPVEPVAWVASKDGRVIYDDASTDDVLLRVSGDFENDEQRIRYAHRIVDKLNAAPAQQDEPVEPVAWSGYDLDGMVEAFSRVIEAHYQRANPFQHPIDMDAQMALRILRGFIPAMKAYTAPPQRKPLPKHDQHCVDVPGYGLTAVRLVRAVERAHGIKE